MAYERSLSAEPKRFRSLLSAARASERLGFLAKAHDFSTSTRSYRATRRGDTERPEPAEGQGVPEQVNGELGSDPRRHKDIAPSRSARSPPPSTEERQHIHAG